MIHDICRWLGLVGTIILMYIDKYKQFLKLHSYSKDAYLFYISSCER